MSVRAFSTYFHLCSSSSFTFVVSNASLNISQPQQNASINLDQRFNIFKFEKIIIKIQLASTIRRSLTFFFLFFLNKCTLHQNRTLNGIPLQLFVKLCALMRSVIFHFIKTFGNHKQNKRCDPPTVKTIHTTY